MPRYTDIDKLIAEYDRVHVGAPGGARKLMVEAPIADVVPRAEVGEHLEDLLTEFDEFGMQPTILVPDAEGMAIEWKRKLVYAIGLIKAEVAREIFEEIFKLMNSVYCEVQHACVGMNADTVEAMMQVGKLQGVKFLGDELAELKKKYTEANK